jgi:hypothetical protein
MPNDRSTSSVTLPASIVSRCRGDIVYVRVTGAADSRRNRTVTSLDEPCGLTRSRNVEKKPCDPSAKYQVRLNAVAAFSVAAP